MSKVAIIGHSHLGSTVVLMTETEKNSDTSVNLGHGISQPEPLPFTNPWKELPPINLDNLKNKKRTQKTVWRKGKKRII